MSQTFSLVCRETNLGVWIGQGRGSMTSLYTGEPATMERLKRFLNSHIGKQLEFVCDDHSDQEWEEFEDPEAEPAVRTS